MTTVRQTPSFRSMSIAAQSNGRYDPTRVYSTAPVHTSKHVPGWVFVLIIGLLAVAMWAVALISLGV